MALTPIPIVQVSAANPFHRHFELRLGLAEIITLPRPGPGASIEEQEAWAEDSQAAMLISNVEAKMSANPLEMAREGAGCIDAMVEASIQKIRHLLYKDIHKYFESQGYDASGTKGISGPGRGIPR